MAQTEETLSYKLIYMIAQTKFKSLVTVVVYSESLNVF